MSNHNERKKPRLRRSFVGVWKRALHRAIGILTFKPKKKNRGVKGERQILVHLLDRDSSNETPVQTSGITLFFLFFFLLAGRSILTPSTPSFPSKKH